EISEDQIGVGWQGRAQASFVHRIVALPVQLGMIAVIPGGGIPLPVSKPTTRNWTCVLRDTFSAIFAMLTSPEPEATPNSAIVTELFRCDRAPQAASQMLKALCGRRIRSKSIFRRYDPKAATNTDAALRCS